MRLCEHYWYPVYAYVRRRGYPEMEAQDLTQDFFVRILEGRYLDRADRKLGDSGHSSSTRASSSSPIRRIGHVPRNAAQGPFCLLKSLRRAAVPFRTTGQRNAGTYLRTQLGGYLVGPGRLAPQGRVHPARQPGDFEKLKVFLLGQAEVPYAELAREMGASEGRLKVAIHRLRKRYRVLFLKEIAETVADPAEVDSEIRFLFSALKGGK